MIRSNTHPCFDAEARHRFGRVHLPVAPRCNLGCNFCNRKFDCLNESRPGVTSSVLAPQQAVAYLEKVMDIVATPLSVVGIAGPGDPFANHDETMQTLRLVRQRWPNMLLCLATNGLAIGPHIAELAELIVSHVTITINAVDPAIGALIYRFVRLEREVLRGVEGATVLLERQLDAIRQLKAHGITVKVNSIVMPGVNEQCITEIARVIGELGVDYHNCMALYPVADTPFAALAEPSAAVMVELRGACEKFVPQIAHCQRCRADAAGLLGAENDELVRQALVEAASGPLRPQDQRPYVAVTSFEGVLVNEHLGEAEWLWVFGPAAGGGHELIETRPAPLPGSGAERWGELARRLPDCRVLLCAGAGQNPQVALAEYGIRVLLAEGLIEEALDAVHAQRKPRMPARVLARAAGCDSDGVGCGGCPGSGTGCG
jgi:nitrogen fixation protein NifB